MKRRIFALAAAVVCTRSVLSMPVANAVDRSPAYSEAGGPVAHTEQTKWYYRMNNGVLEQRLWSITYGHWITAWVPVVFD